MIRRPRTHTRRDARSATLFAAPWLIGLMVLTLLPMAASLMLSFTEWDGLGLSRDIEWVAARNYREAVGLGEHRDPLFYEALTNSLFYTIVAVPAGLAAALLMAILLNARLRGIGLMRTLYMLPYMLGGVATVLVWSWLFNPRFGLINRGLYLAFETLDPLVRVFSPTGTDGWTAPDWFYSPAACKPALIIMHVWLCGGAMLVFLAALQRVPGTLHDAARIDGAGAVRRFFAITLPHISPAIVFNAAVGVIFSMQAFDQAYLLYNRAQRDGLLFYMLRLYRVAFEDPHRLGYASALAWILFVVIAALTAPLVAIAGKRVYYAADR